MDTTNATTLRQMLPKHLMIPISMKRSDGSWTYSCKKTQKSVMDTHFPRCTEVADQITSNQKLYGQVFEEPKKILITFTKSSEWNNGIVNQDILGLSKIRIGVRNGESWILLILLSYPKRGRPSNTRILYPSVSHGFCYVTQKWKNECRSQPENQFSGKCAIRYNENKRSV